MAQIEEIVVRENHVIMSIATADAFKDEHTLFDRQKYAEADWEDHDINRRAQFYRLSKLIGKIRVTMTNI